jgi:hypothetical protein
MMLKALRLTLPVLALLLVSLAAPRAPAALMAESCSPRPPVRIAVVEGGQVSVAATGAGNGLQRLRFETASNAQVEIDGQVRTPPFTVELPSGTVSKQFAVWAISAGQAATITRLIVVDGCDEWPTVVGGGTMVMPTRLPTALPTATATSLPHVDYPPAIGPTTLAAPATRSATAGGADVGVTVGPGVGKQLPVTIVARSGSCAPNNMLRELRFGNDPRVYRNANILIDGHTRIPPFTVALPSGATQMAFSVLQVTTGQDATVSLVARDNCGEWTTVVGGGASAFGPVPQGIPICTTHDPARWHGLAERNPDGSIRCVYDHEHKDDPRVLDTLFGPLSHGTIGLPWAALNAAGSPEIHRTFGWAVVQVPTCLTRFGDGSFTALRVQTHVGYNGATSRDHSYHLEGQTCVPGDPVAGRLSVGGHLDFGALYIDSPQCPVQRVALQADIIRPLLNTSLRRLHGGYPNCPRPDMTWYGANGAIATGAPRVVVNVGVRREDWGQIDPASPSTLHLTNPATANGSSQEPAHLVSVLVPTDWDALDGVQDGRVTYQGFTDRWGNLVANCAPVGMDCVPLWLDRVRTGIEHQFRAEVAGIGEREYDLRVNGQSPITYPN